MSHNKVFVYAFGFEVLEKIPEEQLLQKFSQKRKLTVAHKDFLDNNGNLIKDTKRSLFLTGCESSKKILMNHLRIKPKLISITID